MRPILSDSCFACHGPDAATRKADLRLDQHDGLLTVVVPGDAEASELARRILHQDPDERMPPAESGHELTDPQRQTLWGAPAPRSWFEEGSLFDGTVIGEPKLAALYRSFLEAAWPGYERKDS